MEAAAAVQVVEPQVDAAVAAHHLAVGAVSNGRSATAGGCQDGESNERDSSHGTRIYQPGGSVQPRSVAVAFRFRGNVNGPLKLKQSSPTL
jgi:hypothetical protein